MPETNPSGSLPEIVYASVVADAGGMNLDEHLAGFRTVKMYVFDFERGAGFKCHCSSRFHLVSSCVDVRLCRSRATTRHSDFTSNVVFEFVDLLSCLVDDLHE